MWCRFKDLGDKTKYLETIREYTEEFLDKVANLYNIKLNIKLYNRDVSDLLTIAYCTGMSVLAPYKDGYVIGVGTYVGTLMPDGRMDKVKVALKNGEVFEKPVEEVAVFEWNNLRTPRTMWSSRFANKLADVDVSLDYNVLYSRLCPIPVVDTDNEKKSLETVMENLFNGVMKVFKRTTTFDRLAGGRGTEILNLTQPEASNYIQNLSSIHDEYIIRVCLELGICLNSKDKKAQVNNKELGAFSDYACLSGKSQQRQLELFAQDCERLGITCEWSASPCVYTEDDIIREFNSELGETIEPEEKEEVVDDVKTE